MEKNRHEVNRVWWWIGVETVIPNPRKCACSPDATVESRGDVTSAKAKVNTSAAIRQSQWVPSVSQWCPDEVSNDVCGPSRPEDRGSRVATQRIKVSIDPDFYRARQTIGPDIGGILKCDESLGTQSGPIIAPVSRG